VGLHWGAISSQVVLILPLYSLPWKAHSGDVRPSQFQSGPLSSLPTRTHTALPVHIKSSGFDYLMETGDGTGRREWEKEQAARSPPRAKGRASALSGTGLYAG
jgi:hypothetical protein